MSYKTEKLKIRVRKLKPFFFALLTAIIIFFMFSCKPKVKEEPKYEEKIVSNLVQQQPAFMNPAAYMIAFTDGTSAYVSMEDYATCAIGDTVYLPIKTK
jgi:hypothetical protein